MDISWHSSVEESLLILGQWADGLWAWLIDALWQLGDMEPITVDPFAAKTEKRVL